MGALGAFWLPYSRRNWNAPSAKSVNSSAPRSCTSDPNRVSLRTWLMPVASPRVFSTPVPSTVALCTTSRYPSASIAPTASTPNPTQKVSRPQASTASRSLALVPGERRRAGAQTSHRKASRPSSPPRPAISRKRELVPHTPVSVGPPDPFPEKYGRPGGSPTPKTMRPGTTWESAPRIW